MMEYLVIIERAEDGTYSVFVPDLPGCVTSGSSVDEARTSIREAIQLHIESLRRHGEPVPAPTTVGDLVRV